MASISNWKLASFFKQNFGISVQHIPFSKIPFAWWKAGKKDIPLLSYSIYFGSFLAYKFKIGTYIIVTHT